MVNLLHTNALLCAIIIVSFLCSCGCNATMTIHHQRLPERFKDDAEVPSDLHNNSRYARRRKNARGNPSLDEIEAGRNDQLLTDEYLNRFIVVPEHKLLFCYIEKVRQRNNTAYLTCRCTFIQTTPRSFFCILAAIFFFPPLPPLPPPANSLHPPTHCVRVKHPNPVTGGLHTVQ